MECIGKLDWRLDNACDVNKKQGDIDWPRNYAALLEYYKEHGTCNVPQDAVYECDLKGLGEDGGVLHYVGNLGRWLHTQRQAKKGQGNNKITPERQAWLQKLVHEGEYVCVYFISHCKIHILEYQCYDHLCFFLLIFCA